MKENYKFPQKELELIKKGKETLENISYAIGKLEIQKTQLCSQALGVNAQIRKIHQIEMINAEIPEEEMKDYAIDLGTGEFKKINAPQQS